MESVSKREKALRCWVVRGVTKSAEEQQEATQFWTADERRGILAGKIYTLHRLLPPSLLLLGDCLSPSLSVCLPLSLSRNMCFFFV